MKPLGTMLLALGLWASQAQAQDDGGAVATRPEGRKPYAGSRTEPSPERQRALASTLSKRKARRQRLQGNAYRQRQAISPFVSQMMAQAQQMAAAAI